MRRAGRTRRTPRCRIAAAGLLFALMMPAWAGPSPLRVEAPESKASCLTVPEGRKTPDYPSGVDVRSGAIVRVKLTFSNPDGAPAVEVVFNDGGPAYQAAVSDYVRGYRVPCLGASETLVASQEFQFLRQGTRARILSGGAHGSSRPAVLPAACLDQIMAVAAPVFDPNNGLKGGPDNWPDFGVVAVRLTFTDPAAPPGVEVLFDGGNQRLARVVTENVSAYRLPCVKPDEGRIVLRRKFMFVGSDRPPLRLKTELAFKDVLRLVKDLQSQRVRFDTTTMGCPFKLALAPYRPYAENDVDEVGTADPNRRELLEWLKTVSLDIEPRVMRTAIGEHSIVTVPCMVLDLS